MMEITTPTTVWRTLLDTDLDSLIELFTDWAHDNKPHPRRGIEQQMEKWVNDMRVEPADRPVLPDSMYRESIICFAADTSVLGFLAYIVYGASHPKAPMPGSSTMTLEVFAIAPAHQGAGMMTTLFNELASTCFTYTQVDYIIGLSATPQTDSRALDRGLDKERSTKRDGGSRLAFQSSRQDHLDRIAANPAEDILTTLVEL